MSESESGHVWKDISYKLLHLTFPFVSVGLEKEHSLFENSLLNIWPIGGWQEVREMAAERICVGGYQITGLGLISTTWSDGILASLYLIWYETIQENGRNEDIVISILFTTDQVNVNGLRARPRDSEFWTFIPLLQQIHKILLQIRSNKIAPNCAVCVLIFFCLVIRLKRKCFHNYTSLSLMKSILIVVTVQTSALAWYKWLF